MSRGRERERESESRGREWRRGRIPNGNDRWRQGWKADGKQSWGNETSVFVKNIPVSIDQYGLRGIFKRAGRISDV